VSQEAYRVENLVKIYPKNNVRANDSISLHIRWGEILGLLGPNGAGKTTLVKQLVGLLKPTEGRIWLDGHDVVKNPDIVPHYVAYQGQKMPLLVDITPWEAIYYTGRLRGLPPRAARAQTNEIIERLEMHNFARRPIAKLSGGQQRLAQIAMTLVGHRPILILDEPTAGLDPEHRRLVWDLLLEFQQQKGSTIVLVTHNVLEAEQVVERVGIIDHGKLLALDDVGILKQQVDRRIRLEITAKPGHENALATALSRYENVTRLNGLRFRIYLHRSDVSNVLNHILSDQMTAWINDYRVIPPTLEDVYFHFGGKEVSVES